MRSAVQSCVPLQESTAKRCAFFRLYTLKPCPEGARHYCDSHRKLAFKVAVVVMDAVSEANDGLRGRNHNTKPYSISPPRFLG